jgi:hypothetical protein
VGHRDGRPLGAAERLHLGVQLLCKRLDDAGAEPRFGLGEDAVRLTYSVVSHGQLPIRAGNVVGDLNPTILGVLTKSVFQTVDDRLRDDQSQAFGISAVGATPAAYNGAGQLLEKGEYLLLAGKIVSVEARHATAIRYLIGMKGAATANNGNSGTTVGSNSSGNNNAFDDSDVVNDKGLDRAQKPAEVLATAGPFVKTPITADDIG